jgi:hypothetical protein
MATATAKRATATAKAGMVGPIVPAGPYSGRFVALRSFTNNTVMASGKDAGNVLARARRRGARRPVIVFVPPRNVTCLF